VTVCVAQSTSTPTCAASTSANWQNGWIIFSDLNNDGTIQTGSEPVLRVRNAFSSTDTFVSAPATGAVTFNREGFAHLGNASTRLTLHESSANTTYARCLDITRVGMMATQTNSSDGTCQ
jgi:Tfp pilus assembly protein FimT